MSVQSPGYPYNPTPSIDIGWLVRGWDQYKEKAGTWVSVMLLIGLILLLLFVGVGFLTGFAQYIIAMFQATLHSAGAQHPPNLRLTGPQVGGQLLFSLLVGVLTYLGLGCYYRLALSQLRGEPVGVGTAFAALRSALPLAVVGAAVQFLPLIGAAIQSLSSLGGAMVALALLGYYLFAFLGLIVQGLFMFAPLLVLDRSLGPVAALTESFQLVKSQWIMAVVFFFLGQLLAGAGGLLCGVGTLVTYPLFILGVTIAYLTLSNPPAPVVPDYGQPAPGVWPPPPGSNPQW